MGNTYKNVTLRGVRQAAVLRALAGRTAYVSPQDGDRVVVYDRAAEEEGAPGELIELARSLSATLGAGALAAAVYDDDVLLLWAFEGGSVVFRYDSTNPSSGAAEALCRAISPGASSPSDVDSVLRAGSGLFASEHHARICEALGLPGWPAATGYRYLSQGEPPPGLQLDDLVHAEP